MGKIKVIFCMLLMTAWTTAPLSAQQWAWGNVFCASTLDVTSGGLSYDAAGNVYVAGTVADSVIFPNPITPKGSPFLLYSEGQYANQGFLAKVSPTGTYLWYTRLACTFSSNVCSYVLSNGNIAVLGTVYTNSGADQLVFNGVTYKPHAKLFTYYLLYDQNGNELSASVFSMTSNIDGVYGSYQVGDDIYFGLGVDTTFSDTLWYNNNYFLVSHDGPIRVKMDGNGNVAELLPLGGSGGYGISTMNVNALGETFITAPGDGESIDFGNGIILPALGSGNSRIFAVKFDTHGKALWIQYATSDLPDASHNTGFNGKIYGTLDPQDNLYWAFSFADQMVFNGQTYTSTSYGTFNTCVVKLNADGELVWFDQFKKTVANEDTSKFSDYPNGIIYNKGFLHLYGNSSGYVNFGSIYHGNTTITGLPNLDNFGQSISYMLKMDTTGVVDRIRFFGTAVESLPTSLVANDDILYVTGYTTSLVEFDNNPLMYANFVYPDCYSTPNSFPYVGQFNDCNAQIIINGTSLTASSGTSYQWNNNGNPITGATSQTYDASADATGKYTVDVNFAGGCSSRSATVTIPQNIVTATTDTQANSTLSLYPNPTNDQLTVSVNMPSDGSMVQVQVYNSNGFEILKGQYNSQTSYSLDVKTWPQGMYYVKVSGSTKTVGGAFIKQ